MLITRLLCLSSSLLLLLVLGCKDETGDKFHRLSASTSPYLREHADNPVDWYEWGPEALEKAKRENKPLLISIGFSSCHWCHVMEKESFMDTAVARVMNENFVAVKIDREQRPDIDQIYIHAAQLISGSAGWPLNAFALPDGQPFYAGTYFPKDQWLSLLDQVTEAFKNDRENVNAQAAALTQGIRAEEIVFNRSDSIYVTTKSNYTDILSHWHAGFDHVNGGLNGAPKFPMPVIWDALLQFHALTGDIKSLQRATTTLDRMAAGGIYDHLGGGFARYATDSAWKVPHFEKMLYDNAQLVSLYAHAFQVTKVPLYKSVMTETLDFIRREMTDPAGGFYASVNADSEGDEGIYYTWTKNEIESTLGPHAGKLVAEYYQVTESGNWEDGKNILSRNFNDQDVAINKNIPVSDWDSLLLASRDKLLQTRSLRPRPSTDTKIITSWNALMVTGYLDAYKATSNKAYLQSAVAGADFLQQRMMTEGHGVWRNYSNGEAGIAGFLDDYANLSLAFIKLYQQTFDIKWLQQARLVADFAIAHFRDAETGFFFYTSELSEGLVARKKEISDEVMPSSNSVMAEVLFLLGEYYQESTYTLLSETMLDQIKELYHKPGGLFYSNWFRISGLTTWRPYEVAILGEQALERSQQMQRHFLPLALFSGGRMEDLPLLDNKLVKGKTMIYVCRDKVCKLPVEEVEHALNQLTIAN